MEIVIVFSHDIHILYIFLDDIRMIFIRFTYEKGNRMKVMRVTFYFSQCNRIMVTCLGENITPCFILKKNVILLS